MVVSKHLRIASRKSPLACWQANRIKDQLEKCSPCVEIEVIFFVTGGDGQPERVLSKSGGKGLFVKELEIALLHGEADMAVHSMKDVPMALSHGLMLAVIDRREDPRDVLVSRLGERLKELPFGAMIGSSSVRRQSQLLALRSDLKVNSLHGNVGTRLDKLAAGECDAVILAAAGLIRLGKAACISEYFATSLFLPAPGQGALGIECRSDDEETQMFIAQLNHRPTYSCVVAERAFSRRLGGGCQTPIAAYAQCLDHQIYLQGLVAKPDGSVLLKVEKHGVLDDAERLGIAAAEALMAQGADGLLQEIGSEPIV